ncbi:hypothetical protein CYMTET_55622 [Cymbomonas tetramitiformis]|uniref:Uncharacterized protein n=1 Tax=Cymbomonas tetramitiformis TaxID=36881 RepID=A0AAE0BCL7_9CHLO|nr:hypothetical protein CYMTET_55622 [Cymbomonas tetramitiformis]
MRSLTAATKLIIHEKKATTGDLEMLLNPKDREHVRRLWQKTVIKHTTQGEVRDRMLADHRLLANMPTKEAFNFAARVIHKYYTKLV